MKNFIFSTMAAGVLASAAVGLAASAHAAPSGSIVDRRHRQPTAVAGLSGHRESSRRCVA